MTDGRTTDTFIYFKLTFGSGELKKHNLCKGLCPKYVCQVSASSHMLSEKIFKNVPFVWPQQSMIIKQIERFGQKSYKKCRATQ